ncbi:ATP synthase F0 subunit 8 (mitochondrion) [Paramicrosporidium saccamoebae]|uniref:ATP synthase F0 subunit 8 n=1 Tax=Paramicrosporidium saccamoebae TaxID=1246581 RepID=A0A2H9TR25_9FUNG|nr:ATP synthase F0 subunit 8 [Paramicrosporidium saccamoebae]
MAQCNVYTYLSQTTWTIIIFYFLYYYMKQYILPSIYEQIKLKNYTTNSTLLDKTQTVQYLSTYTTKWNEGISKVLSSKF